MCLYAAVQANAVQCIVFCAQAFDTQFVSWFGKTCGLGISGFNCVAGAGVNNSPFLETTFISFGLLATIILTIPLGILNLDDNIFVQIIAFIITIFFAVQWSVASFLFKSSIHDVALDPAPVIHLSNTGIATALGTMYVILF